MQFIPEYQKRANGFKEVPSVHKVYDSITEKTFGIIIYQEQCMEIAKQMGGYSAAQADYFRKGIGKKDQELVKNELNKLKEAMMKNGYSEELGQKIYDLILPFANYGFNRSHAAAYSYIAYQTAYFKTYYPIEFMCGVLTIFGDNQDKCSQYIADAKRMGIPVLGPDLNTSGKGFTIDGTALRYGFASVKGMGEAVIENLISMQPFASLEDMIERVPKRILNKRVINVLCRSGALDGLGLEQRNRLAILQYLYMLRGDKDDISYEVDNYTKRSMLQDEKDLIGIYVSSHPLEEVCEKMNFDYIGDNETFETAGIIRSFKEIRTKKNQLMAMVNLETLSGELKLVIFPDVFEKLDVPLQEDLIVKFSAYFKFNFQYNERSCLAKKFTIPKRINASILKK